MASLSFPEIQTVYAAACKQIRQDWGTLSSVERKDRFGAAVNKALTRCSIPAVTVVDGPQPQLDCPRWEIRFGGGYVSDNVAVDLFGTGASTLYHEARHAEQWYRIAQGLAAGKLPLPGAAGAGPWPEQEPAVVYRVFPGRMKFATACHAYDNRAHYPQHMHPQVQGWYRSVLGAASAHRAAVLQAMYSPGAWQPYFGRLDPATGALTLDPVTHKPMPYADANFAAYLALSEEEDAYRMQDEVLARLANMLNMWA